MTVKSPRVRRSTLVRRILLRTHLAPLQAMGIDTATEQVFRTLAANIAGWLLPRVEGR